jgi:hypothetical protein
MYYLVTELYYIRVAIFHNLTGKCQSPPRARPLSMLVRQTHVSLAPRCGLEL